MNRERGNVEEDAVGRLTEREKEEDKEDKESR